MKKLLIILFAALSLTECKHTYRFQRYFLVSYSTKFININDAGDIQGNISIISDRFPARSEIDSVVYSYLLNKKSAYQSIIITSIFEFHSENDYRNFNSDVINK